MPEDLSCIQAPASPNSRRVRMFLAEKGISLPLLSIDLAAGEQHSDAYRAINPRRVVPTLVLEDGTAIGEVLAIWRYLEEAYPLTPLLGTTPKDKALVTMWERRATREGFAAVMEGCTQRCTEIVGPRHRGTARLRADPGAGRAEQTPGRRLLRRHGCETDGSPLHCRRNLFRRRHHHLGDGRFRYVPTATSGRSWPESCALRYWDPTVAARPGAAA